jgi:hypothetical protein
MPHRGSIESPVQSGGAGSAPAEDLRRLLREIASLAPQAGPEPERAGERDAGAERGLAPAAPMERVEEEIHRDAGAAGPSPPSSGAPSPREVPGAEPSLGGAAHVVPERSAYAATQAAGLVGAGSARESPALDAVDQALALEVDALLSGEFESVSEVLEGVFEDAAALVEHSAADAVVWTDRTTRGAAMPMQEPRSAPEAEAEGDLGEAAPPAEALATAPGPPGWARAWRRVETPLIAVLSVVNAPVRRVPEPARHLVDWLALTLVFWVPVVWVIALVLVG